MQDGELFYRFRKVLDLMQEVGKLFLGAEKWKEFEDLSKVFVQRFGNNFPTECRVINVYTIKILSNKRCSADLLDIIRYMINIVSEEYEEKEKKLQRLKPNKVFISHSQNDIKIVEKFVDLLNRIGLDWIEIHYFAVLYLDLILNREAEIYSIF